MSEECQELHVEVDFSVRAYAVCPGSTAFRKWFDEVFSIANPSAATAFAFSNTELEGETLLEVMGYDPLLSIDSLETLWLHYKLEQAEKPKSTIKVKSTRVDLN